MSVTKLLTTPSLLNVMDSLKKDIFRSLNCVSIGKIVNFDASKKTAEVEIAFKKILPSGDTQKSYHIVDCPVFSLQGGSAAIQMPITVGDQCVVFFADRNMNSWFKTGSAQAPPSGRCHDFSDGIVFVGLNSLTSPMGSYSSTEARFYNGTGKIGIQANKVTITNGAATLLSVLDGLIDVVKALTVGGAPIDASGLLALEAYKTTLAGLLY